MNDKTITEIRLKDGYESIVLEMGLPLSVIRQHLEQLGVCREVKSNYRNLASYYTAYHRKTIPADEIIYIKADHAYCTFHFCDDSRLVKSKPMGYYLEKYYAGSLIRIHKTYALNKNYLKQIRGGYVVLNDDTRLPVGRKHKVSLYPAFSQAM
jgi:DNA-binding LytR/AlgR family response regulator